MRGSAHWELVEEEVAGAEDVFRLEVGGLEGAAEPLEEPAAVGLWASKIWISLEVGGSQVVAAKPGLSRPKA